VQDITLILLGAGNSSRFNAPIKKQWLYSGDSPLWLKVAKDFESCFGFTQIIIVSTAQEIALMSRFADYAYVEGGESRQESLSNAIAEVQTPYVLVSDIARCCIDKAMVRRILDAKEQGACIVPALMAVDTLYLDDAPIDRQKVRAIQTPQLSKTETLKKALQTKIIFTDESSAIASLGEKVTFVDGSATAHKLTKIEDLNKLPCLRPPVSRHFVGFGLDTHAFEEQKAMVLCGVKIDVPYGFQAHSDGDVAIHALIDALLGAAGMGDIGELYPDSDQRYAKIDSTLLLADTLKRITSFGFVIHNVDMTIVAQVPKLMPYKEKMRRSLASLLQIKANFVNIKATTSENLGFIGRKEGVTVHAVATLGYYDWQQNLNRLMQTVEIV